MASSKKSSKHSAAYVSQHSASSTSQNAQNTSMRNPSPYDQPTTGARTSSPYDQQSGGTRQASPYDQQYAGARQASPYDQQYAGARTSSPYDQQNTGARTSSPYDQAAPTSNNYSPYDQNPFDVDNYSPYDEHHHHSHHHNVARRAVIIGGTVVVVVGAVAVVGYFAGPSIVSNVIDSLTGDLREQSSELVENAEGLIDAISDLDFELARERTLTVRDLTAEMKDEVTGGIWNVATIVPNYGSDVKQIQTLLDIVLDLCDDAMLPLCDAMIQTPLQSLFSSGDDVVYVDMAALTPLLDTAHNAMALLKNDIDEIEAMEEFHIDELTDMVDRVTDVLAPFDEQIDTIDEILVELPRLLGSEGFRTYMLVAQANCEIRSTGGFPGAIGMITADNGIINMGDFGSLYDVMLRDDTVRLEVSDEEIELFGEDVSWYAGIMNFIPHFPRVCDMWSQECAIQSGIYLDGVIALDPVFLQNVLALYGSVTMDDGTVIDGSNAAQLLMSDVYWRYIDDNDAQNAFFYQAAELAFDFVMEHLMDAGMGDLFSVLNDSMDNRRLTAWMADAGSQQLFALLGGTGELNQDPARPRAGIYLGDETWGKIEWYLDTELIVQGFETGDAQDLTHLAKKKVEGQIGGSYRVSFTLRNNLSWDQISTNYYVFGSDPLCRTTGDMVLKVWIYAPCGGYISDFVAGPGTMTDWSPEFKDLTHMGLQVMFGTIQLYPGEEMTISYDVTCSADTIQELVFDVTPICHD